MSGAIISFVIGTLILAFFTRLVRRTLSSRRQRGKPIINTAQQPLTSAEALRLLDSLYKNALQGKKILRADVLFLERSLPHNYNTGEILDPKDEIVEKLIFLWQKAGMTNPKKGDR